MDIRRWMYLMLVELCSPWLSDWSLFVLIIELWLSYARRGLVIEFCSIVVDSTGVESYHASWHVIAEDRESKCSWPR